MNVSLRWRLLLVTSAIAAAALVGVAAFSIRITTTEIRRSIARAAPAPPGLDTFEDPLPDFWHRHRNWDGVQTELERLAAGHGQLGGHPFADRLPVHREIARLVARSTYAGETKKLKVSGFPSPRLARRSVAYRPNSIRRVFSGCSSSPNFPTRSRNCSGKRAASSPY